MSGLTHAKGIWLLLAATLFLRALVPAGWMPDTTSGVLVAKVCNADYTMRIPLKRDSAPGDGKAHKSDHCLFTGFGAGAALPTADIGLPAAPPAEQRPIAALAALLLERTAYLLPPGRAPPLTA